MKKNVEKYRKILPDDKVNPVDHVLIDIGGKITWVKRCVWERGNRCCGVARTNEFCRWHLHCLETDPVVSEDLHVFEEWHQRQQEGPNPLQDFKVCLGTFDPYHDARLNFGQNKYKPESKYSVGFAAANRDLIRGITRWMNSGEDAGSRCLELMAEKHPPHAASFLIASRRIKAWASTATGLLESES